MKAKTLLISSLAFLAAMASCKKEQMAEPEVNPSKGGETITGEYTYTFEVNSDDAKTIYGTKCLVWENGDLVGSYAQQDAEIVSSNQSTAVELGQEHAIITLKSSVALKAGDKAYFYYPHSSVNKEKSPSELNLQIPTEQVSGDADAMPMVAVPVTLTSTVEQETATEVGKVQFVNLGSVIKINVYSSAASHQGEVVESVTFNAGAPVAGSFSYDITNLDPASPAAISGYDKTSVNAGARVDVGATAAEGGVVYLVVAPGTYMGSFIVHTDKADYTYTSDKNRTFVRAGLKSFNFDLATNNWDESTGYDTNIDSPREFAEFLAGTSASDTQSYTITADLDMTGYTALNASGFGGTLDGGNHRVYNITAGKALFASNKGAIKNLTLEGSFSSSTEYFLASLVKEDAGGVYDNVINKASVTFTATADVSSGMALGGLVAAAKGADFDNCYNYGDVTVNAEGHYHSALGMGGFAGYSLGNTTMDKCYNYGAVKDLAKAAKTRTNIVIWGTTYKNNNVAVAGFVGRDLTTFASEADCTETKLKANALAINQCENKKGADVVVSYSDITILGSSGEGYASVAGIAGMGNVYIYKCLNYADVKTSALGGAVSIKELIMRVGGILGRPYDYCYVGSSKMEGNLTYINDNTCDIANSKAAVGGIVGNAGYNGYSGTGFVEIYYNTMNGDIAASGKGKNYSVGGIVGHGGKQIGNKVNASCKITLKDESNSGWKFVGGLVGTLFGDAKYTTVKSSTSAATIEVTSTNNKIAAGGLLGFWGGANTSSSPCLTARDGTPCQFTGSITCNQPYVGVAIGKVDGSSTKTCKFGDSDNPIKASGTINGTTINTANVENLAIGENLSTTTIYITSPTAPDVSANLLTLNIRQGSNWSDRKGAIVDMIKDQNPIVVGLQEVADLDVWDHMTEDHPYDYLCEKLTDYTGVRLEKKSHNVFFYRNSRITVSNTGYFTIEDENYDRAAVYANLYDNESQKNYFYLNTHLPLSQSARTAATALIQSKIAELNTNNYPVIIMGDFNGVQGDSCFDDFKTVYDNTRYSAESYFGTGTTNRDLYTYNAFGDSSKDRNKIDHIWVSKSVKVLYYVTITQDVKNYGGYHTNNEYFLSDHYPVMATIC